MQRKDVLEALADVVGFATVTASRLGASNSVELQIVASKDESDSTKKNDEWCEWWGEPGISFKPEAGAEAMYIDLNGERVVIGVKSRKYQIAVEDGECVVRAFGPDSPAYVKLKPDGSIEVHGHAFLGGDATTATFGVPLAELIATAVNAALVGHTHLSATAGSPTGPGVVTVPVLASAIASATVKAL